MLSQKEFVEGCYNWYREADLQPGNPEDGDWDEAHYPVPKCKGGTETILLLKEHHAVQGVIQSEELQWRCIFGWEEKYLEGENLELFNKWMSEGMKLHWASKTEEEKILWTGKLKASAVARHARMTEEEKILKAEKVRTTWKNKPEEEVNLRREHQRSFLTSWWEEQTPEEKIQQSNKMKEGWARRKFNKEVEDLVAVWEMGLRP